MNDSWSKSAKSWGKQKSSKFLWIFFSIKDNSLGAHFFKNFNFWHTSKNYAQFLMLSYIVFINYNDFLLLFRTHHLWNSTTEMKLLYVYDLLRGIWILNRQAFSRRISCLHTARIHRLRTHLWRHQQNRHHLLRAYDLSSLANFLFEVNLKFKTHIMNVGNRKI